MAQDPKQWFDGLPRVLFVHAHPDDETITTGGTLAGLAEAGQEPLLVTLTRGEQGEVVQGPLVAMAATHGLAVVRQNELATAIGMLGLERHAFLGAGPARAEGLPPYIYEDSGMQWADQAEDASRSTPGPLRPSAEAPRAVPDPNAGPDALTRVPAMWALNDLLAAALGAGAQAVVSYDDGGGYGHPDHRFAHGIARAVAQALELPFWEIVPAEEQAAAAAGVVGAVADVGTQAAGTVGATDAADPESRGGIETHDIEPWFDRKVAALRAHVTQLTVQGDEIVHVGGQREPIGRAETFRRVSAP